MTRIPSKSFRRMLDRSHLPDQEIASVASVSRSTVYRWRTGESTPAVAHVSEITEHVASHARQVLLDAKKVYRDMGYWREMQELDTSGPEAYRESA